MSVEDRLDSIEERLDKIEKLLTEHCYGGVPSDHKTINSKLDEILKWMTRRRKEWQPTETKKPLLKRLYAQIRKSKP